MVGGDDSLASVGAPGWPVIQFPELGDLHESASWGEDGGLPFDLDGELELCVLHTLEPLELRGVGTTWPCGVSFPFNLHFLHGSLLVLHRGVPEDSFNIC